MRDGFSEGFFTRRAHEKHPVDLMCAYLLHGSVERIPGLLAAPETLSYGYLNRHVDARNRASSGDADMFSLSVERKIRGRLFGVEFRVYFDSGEAYADAVVPYGAPVGLARFLHHFRGDHASGGDPGDWDFDVYTDVGFLPQGIVLFGNRREVWYTVNGRRVDVGRLQGNVFGATAHTVAAGGTVFPDRDAGVEGTSAEVRAYRRQMARLGGPLPLRAGRRPGLEFGARRGHTAR
ncbi:hypothetical protein AB0M43_13280 [Longispora sp. NPDC051575]|uniref:hypothetical protein n=1 Tax=Longispora sp. NPDC051575 TaxID=3154943 RepID=UPI0034175A2B